MGYIICSMSILRNISYIVQNQKMKKKLRKCKFVHMMFNDKFCAPFVDFLNRNFNTDEHLVICKRWFKEFPFPEGSNVVEVKNLKYVDFSHDNIKKIICHSLFDGELVHYLYDHPDILKKKAYWVMWGGDLYEAPRDEMNDFVRENFKGYLGTGDNDYLTSKYFIKNKVFFDVINTFPVEEMLLNQINTGKTHDFVKIQINNSADETTLEMLDILYKFQCKKLRIVTVISYGNMEYNGQIIDKGKELFGNNFEYVDTMMSPKIYAKHLAENDILILYQKRQQGFGNALASLYLGKKVFIRKEIGTYSWLNERKIHVYDSNIINSLSFDELVTYDDKAETVNSIKQHFCEDTIVKMWKRCFDAV